MNEARQEFITSLNMSGYSYSIIGNNQIKIIWSNNSIPPVTSIFTFSDDGSDVEIESTLMGAPADKQVDALYVCSALNMQSRWVRFCIDSENQIIAKTDAIIEYGGAGIICLRLLNETREIIGALYWTMMKVILNGIQSIN